MVNKPSSPSVTPALATKPAHHRDELPIAILAAGLVSENDRSFDNGSEMPLVINMIPDDITFTGICYSHRVFMALNESPMPPPSYAVAPIGRRAMPSTIPATLRRWIHSIRVKCLSPPAAFTNILASAGLTRRPRHET